MTTLLPEPARPDPSGPVLLQVNQVQPLEAYRSLVLTLFKWKLLILGLGLCLALAAAITVVLQPSVWLATAKILLKGDRVPLQVPGLGSAGTGSRGASPEEMATEIEFFESAAVLVPAVRALRAARGEPTDVPDSELRGPVGQLRARIDVTTVPGTTVLQVMYSGESRQEAEETLRLVMNHYVEQHARAYSGGSRLTAFYEQQLRQTGDELREAEDRFRQWQDANNVVTVDGQIEAQVSRLTGIDTDLKRTEVEIEAARAAIASLTGQVAAQPERSVASRQHGANPVIARLKAELSSAQTSLRDAPSTPLISRLKGDLVTAQIAVNDLRQRYLDADRRVVEKLEQIALIERALVSAEREATSAATARVEALKAQLADAEREGEVVHSETVAANPLRESLARERAGVQARLTSLLSQADAQRGQLKEVENGLTALRAKRVDFDRLARRVELAKALYVTNSKRLDDSRIVASLEKHQLSNVAVIDGARASETRSTTRELTLIGLAGVVGLGLGVAAAFAAELLNGTLRTPQEVESYLGIPVVAAVPASAGAGAAAAFPVHAETAPGPMGRGARRAGGAR
jgi:uncharacterized protein involved in exopolysaccharide biosynthesis